MNRYRFGWIVCLLLVSFMILAVPPGALGQYVFYGTSEAQPSGYPELWDWEYCITLTWDVPGISTISHFDVLLQLEACPCVCDFFSFAALDVAGTSNGEAEGEPCTVEYWAYFTCQDPSTGIEVPLVKFEPLEICGCFPMSQGTGTFCFFSNWAPVEITDGDGLLVLKSGDFVGFGELTGVLPTCTCPTGTEGGSWGGVKILFR
jgi:hypothetical protein